MAAGIVIIIIIHTRLLVMVAGIVIIIIHTSNGSSGVGYFSLKCCGTNELQASYSVGKLNNKEIYM